MITLRTVLCPVDFSAATPRQVDIAADLCRAFGARLIIHHNRHWLGTGASVGWMWKADHHGECQDSLESKLAECVARVPKEVAAESLITEGPVSRAVRTVAEAIHADLVILTAHGSVADDHTSITESLLEDGDRAVLVLHEPVVEPRAPHFASSSADERQIVVATTDLTPESVAALNLAFDLARRVPIELHLLHLLPGGTGGPSQALEDEARRQMRALVPPDLADRARLHVEHGDPANRGIARTAERLDAACIVMGEHTRAPFRRWFSRDTSRAVLRQAHCPIWYVPGSRTVRVTAPLVSEGAEA